MRERDATLAVVLVATALSAFWGLAARDLTGDELALGDHIAGVLGHCYMPSSPDDFSAHLPLFGVLRALLLKAMPDSFALARRLPAALLILAGAAAHWWLFARERRWGAALAAGLVFGLHPLASFYAHDSSNYALSPLCAVFVLAGLADLRARRERGALWLGVGLVLGTFSDFFFAFVVSAAAVGTWWAVRGEDELRRTALKAWVALLAIQAMPAIVLIRHLTRFPVADFVAPHADSGGGHDLDPFRGLANHATLVMSSYFEGYHLAWEADRTLLVAGVLLAAVGVWRGLRGGPTQQVAAGLLLGVLGQMLLVGFVFTAVTGRFAPLAVRSHMALLSPLVVVWIAAVGEPKRGRAGSLAAVGLACLVASLGARTAWQLAHPAASRQPIADRLVQHWHEGDGLISMFLLHDRLPAGFPGMSDVDPCLPEGPEPKRLWVVGDPGSTWPDTIAPCGGGEPLINSGWALRYVEQQPIPFYEWDSGSFLVGTALYLFERKPLGDWPWPPARFEVREPPADQELLVRWRVPEMSDDDFTTVPMTPTVELPPMTAGADRLEVTYVRKSEHVQDLFGVEPAGHAGLRITLGRAAGPIVWTDAPSLTVSLAGGSRRTTLLVRRGLAAVALLCALGGLALAWGRE